MDPARASGEPTRATQRPVSEPELPRASQGQTPASSASRSGLMGRWMSDHRASVSAVLLGMTALPMVAGCAMQDTQPEAPPDAQPEQPGESGSDEAGFDAFRSAAADINSRRGQLSEAELAQERAALWGEFAAQPHPSQQTDADGDGLSLAREILFGSSDSRVDSDGDGVADAEEVRRGREPGVADAIAPGTSLAQLADAALAAVFAGGAHLPLSNGDEGPGVVAAQYALGRLGYLDDIADGDFGPKTEAAVVSMQSASGLEPTGALDVATVLALDAQLALLPTQTPAAAAADPVAFLSDFAQFNLSPVHVSDHSQPVSWSHPDIKRAYGVFVSEYWEVMKDNRVEADCKTLALFFMDQFRGKVLEDTGTQLPLPRSSTGAIPSRGWVAATADNDRGFFQRVEELDQVRSGYEVARAIQDLDPNHSLLTGVNLRYPEVSTAQVARAATIEVPWSASFDNAGDKTQPEIPIQGLEAGHMIFIDHTGDGTYDHTVNVLEVQRDGDGKVRTLRMAVGSFDDMKDGSADTAPRGLGDVNNYTEEVVVRFSAAGKVTGSEVTWSSEGSHTSKSRYTERTTLMELKPGGTLAVARWDG